MQAASAPRVIKLATRDADGASKRRGQTLLLATSPAPETAAPEPVQRARASRAVGWRGAACVSKRDAAVQARRSVAVGASATGAASRDTPESARDRMTAGSEGDAVDGAPRAVGPTPSQSARLRVSRLTAGAVGSPAAAEGTDCPTRGGEQGDEGGDARRRGGRGV